MVFRVLFRNIRLQAWYELLNLGAEFGLVSDVGAVFVFHRINKSAFAFLFVVKGDGFSEVYEGVPLHNIDPVAQTNSFIFAHFSPSVGFFAPKEVVYSLLIFTISQISFQN